MSRKNRFRNNLVVLLLLGSATVLTIMLVMASCGGARLSTDPGAALLSRSGSGAMSPWRMFGANSLRTRLSEHTGPPTNRLKWKYATKCDVNYSSPAIAADGTIYIGDKGEGQTSPKLYAINSKGKVKWTFPTIGGVDSPALSADGGTVYIGGGYRFDSSGAIYLVDTRLYAVSSGGNLRWSYATGGPIVDAPVVGSDGTVYVGSFDGNLYAINSDGTLRWTFPTSDRIHSSPAIGADGTLYFATYQVSNGIYSGNFYALNPDGTENWQYSIADSAFFSSPAVGADGTIYIGMIGSDGYPGPMDGALLAFSPAGSLDWSYQTSGPIYSSPALGADGAIYFGVVQNGAAGELIALNANGTLRWSFDQGSGNYSIKSSPAIGADGTIYVADYNSTSGWAGRFYAVNPVGSLKWSYNLPGPSISSPAIGSDGTVYVGSDGPDTGSTRHGLFAFGPGLN